MFQQSQLNNATIISTNSFAQKGKFPKALRIKKDKLRPWIVDSGASDHMTGDTTLFVKYNPCIDNLNVRIADGSLKRVIGIGSIIVLKDLTLEVVLLVQNLDCNLFFVSKLVRDLNYVTKFFPNMCEFQDLDLEKTIDNARMCARLYILKVETPEGQSQENNCMALSSNSNKDSAIMLWHYRLRHPNFIYLEKLFPSLFNKNKKSFQCEIC